MRTREAAAVLPECRRESYNRPQGTIALPPPNQTLQQTGPTLRITDGPPYALIKYMSRFRGFCASFIGFYIGARSARYHRRCGVARPAPARRIGRFAGKLVTPPRGGRRELVRRPRNKSQIDCPLSARSRAHRNKALPGPARVKVHRDRPAAPALAERPDQELGVARVGEVLRAKGHCRASFFALRFFRWRRYNTGEQ